MKKKIYVAHCIEAGERFNSNFKTVETDKEKLYRMGCEHAAEWGGECTSVSLWKPKKLAKVWDLKENRFVLGTAKSWDAFKATHLNSTRYDWTRFEYFLEEEPKDLWDNDISVEENLRLADMKGAVK